ncbi:MAG: V-type ATP synthase subunit D [Tissierellia bacterium]|nr:V-type ATP synthase subunit D [Tissierellia bacterium]
MAKMNVNPTRMELSNLKKRLTTASRGHKLLKDKQDELMRQFIDRIKENRALRESVEAELQEAFNSFLVASAVMSPEMLEEAVSFPKERIEVDIKEVNVMSVMIPEMKFERSSDEEGSIFPYGFTETSAELDTAIEKLYNAMGRLLELAAVEKACQLMANEIEKSRRRVNALEYRMIPDLQETIKFIMMKLDENERATITRLMKVKDIISEEA